MGKITGIGWTNSTFNIVHGCVEIPHDPACTHCYAREFSKRLGKDLWGKTKPRQQMGEHYWNDPLRWDRKAAAAGIRHKVFCSSMADVFEDHPDLVAPREQLWKLIERTPNLIWQLLTKRPENMKGMVPASWRHCWPTNIWAGTTVANQEWADKRCPILAEIPARVRWLSVEPMFGPMDLSKHFEAGHESGGPAGWIQDPSPFTWTVVGGESGNGARPMKREWVTDLLAQCRKYKVAFFFKQKGNVMAKEMGCKDAKGADPSEFPEEFRVQEFPA